MFSFRHSRRAFTLIELLVVLGTISLLTSLLMPQLNDAKESAKVVLCGSHLHNNDAAIKLYGHDNKQAYPDFFYDFPPGQNMANTVVIQFKPKKAATTGWSYFTPASMICPCDDHPNQVHVISDHTGAITDMDCSYDVNVDFLLRSHRQDQVNNPHGLALMFDGNIGDGVKQGAYLGTQSWVDGAFNKRHHQRAITSIPTGPGNGNNSQPTLPPTGTGKLGSVLWGDGHVTAEPALPLSSFIMAGDKEWVHGNTGGSGGGGGGGSGGGGGGSGGGGGGTGGGGGKKL